MIDSAKKLLTGILSFFVGLFAGKKAQTDKQLKSAPAKTKKRSGYFMELDESEDNILAAPVAAVKQTVDKAKNATVEAAKQVTDTVKTSEPVAAAKQAVDKAKTSEPVAATKQAVDKAKSSEPVAAAKQAVDKAKTPEPPVAAKTSKVELVQTAEGLKAELAKPSKSVAANSNGQSKTETTFAPKYLNPANSSNSRRRPGANMTNFLDMASQVKSPAKG